MGRRWRSLPEVLFVSILFGFVGFRLIQDIGLNGLWTDEFFTISFAYLSQDVPIRWAPLLPEGPIRWIGVLSTAFEPQFPTHYVATRVLSSAIYIEGMEIEQFARLPSVIMVLVALLSIPAIAVWRRADAIGWLFVVVLLASLVGDPDWREHANEARAYGAMATFGVAVVAALHFGSLPLAAVLGLALVLLHPFGLFVGLAPSAAILARRGVDLSRSGFRLFLVLLGFVLAVTLTWLVLKFGLKALGSGAAATTRPAGRELLRAINPWAASGSIIGLAGCAARLRVRRMVWPPCIVAYCALLGLVGVFAVLLLLAPVQAFPRYGTWLNSVLFAVAASCFATVLSSTVVEPWRAIARAGTLATGVLAAVAAMGNSFGPVWGNDLRGAARYLNALTDGAFAVAHDSAEVLDFPAWYRTGLRCFRGGQIIPYLSEELRRHVLCEDSGRVPVPEEIERLYIVREPIAWIGTRQLLLEGFTETTTLQFGRAWIEIYDRAPSR